MILCSTNMCIDPVAILASIMAVTVHETRHYTAHIDGRKEWKIAPKDVKYVDDQPFVAINPTDQCLVRFVLSDQGVELGSKNNTMSGASGYQQLLELRNAAQAATVPTGAAALFGPLACKKQRLARCEQEDIKNNPKPMTVHIPACGNHAAMDIQMLKAGHKLEHVCVQLDSLTLTCIIAFINHHSSLAGAWSSREYSKGVGVWKMGGGRTVDAQKYGKRASQADGAEGDVISQWLPLACGGATDSGSSGQEASQTEQSVPAEPSDMG